MKIISLTSAIMGALGMLIISLESDASYYQEQHQGLSQDTDDIDPSKTSEASIEQNEGLSARSYHSLGDLRPIPSLLNILHRNGQLERMIKYENMVETNVSLLQLKRKLRALLMASSTVEQRYAFNQIKDIDNEILLENRLETLDGEVEIIRLMMSTAETNENKEKLCKILDSLMEEVNKLYVEIQEHQRELENEGTQYISNLIKNTKVDRRRDVVKMDIDEALISAQQFFNELQLANKQARYHLRVTNEEWDPAREAEIAILQGKIKAMVDNLLSIRAKIQAAINWLVEDIDGSANSMDTMDELDSVF